MDFIKEYNYLNSIYDHARFPALIIFFLQHIKNKNIYGLSSLFTDFLGPWALGQNFFLFVDLRDFFQIKGPGRKKAKKALKMTCWLGEEHYDLQLKNLLNVLTSAPA